MPSNQTVNYQLSQWERDDKILMEDFNADNAKTDTALGDHARRVAALERQVPLLGNCRVATYSYVGIGGTNETIIPFPEKPMFVLIIGENGSLCAVLKGSKTGVTLFSSVNPVTAQWSDTQLVLPSQNSVSIQMNMPDVRYRVMMFLQPKS